ncbi:MAG: AlpA family transcriptional regulator [Zoogloeaceae bacterium]|jgi:prophage regulatory protein|nr:AlpA family transcriptional regulator [Zoogloeaceae bacterium]
MKRKPERKPERRGGIEAMTGAASEAPEDGARGETGAAAVMTQASPAAATRIVRIKELSRMIGLSRVSIYNRLNPQRTSYDPAFPRPVRLGPRSVGFRADEIEAWLAGLPRTLAVRPAPAGKHQDILMTGHPRAERAAPAGKREKAPGGKQEGAR